MAFDFQSAFQRALPYNKFLDRWATDEQKEKWRRQYELVALSPLQRSLVSGFTRKMPILCLTGPWCGDCVEACPILERIAEANKLIDLRFVNRVHKFDQAAAATTIQDDDIRKKPIGKILVKWGILTPERVEKALLVQEEERSHGLNVRIGDVMTKMGLITEQQRDSALAQQAGFATLDDADRQLALELSICGGPRVPMIVFLSEDGFECARFGERPLSKYRAKMTQRPSCPTGLVSPAEDLNVAMTQDWLDQFERVQWMLQTSPRLMKLHGEL